ncbi:putative peptide chain release factor C12orf65, mitochondrial [Intoshia linei]|uniref:Putative peptide chain release factor C12orf65, mitochondrial n=1 Tax=Intoshia linei TaxID=1819745 RepID=A0A177BAS0_9BILA|nr:putative peptide chain release factor C12orf65, mitochondrial [Intoshia linei]
MSKTSKLAKYLPEIIKKDVVEDWVKGWGPGGQSVNTSSNCLVLKHLPTGIVIKCHETKSIETNRKRAYERLQVKLDQFKNGENSVVVQLENKLREKQKRNNISKNKHRETAKHWKEYIKNIN